MENNENLRTRVNQLDEQVSHLLRAVDTFHAEMVVFKEYLLENTRVVNGILRKIDDNQEESNRRFEQLEKRFEKMDQRFEKMDQRFEKMDQRFEKTDKRIDDILKEMAHERKLRDAQFEFIVKQFESRM